jgi:hypothetical protein
MIRPLDNRDMTLPPFDPAGFIQAVGYIGIFLSIFIESGLIIGLILPLPGETLLFTAGVFAASNTLNLALVIALSLLGVKCHAAGVLCRPALPGCRKLSVCRHRHHYCY